MHCSVMEWVEGLVQEYKFEGSILEVGSLNENGSVRPLFIHSDDYVGADMRDGRDVDVVAHAHNLPFVDSCFDAVVSTEMLEHDPQFWLSLPEMGRVLRPEGLLVITARGNGFPRHAFPSDYWRFMPEAAPLLLSLAGCFPISFKPDPDPQAPGIFALGRKSPALEDDLEEIKHGPPKDLT